MRRKLVALLVFITRYICKGYMFLSYKQVAELKNAIGPLSGCSLQFCTDACFRRYLEARNWNLDKSKKMLEETLKWRAAFKPEEIRWVHSFDLGQW